MEITFLGTSAGLPTKERNTQATVLSLNPLLNEYWLFDAGEAVQHQILHTRIKLGKLSAIFITHMHGDHLFGLPGLLSSRSFQGGENKPLTVYGPVGIKSFIETTLSLSASHLNYPLEVIEVEDSDCFERHDIRIKVGLLSHGVPSYGYRLEFPDQEGRLLQEKLVAEGIAPGPVYREFKSQDTVYYGGKVYDASTYRAEQIPGKIITFFGDTMPSINEEKLAADADIIVHESTYLEGDLGLSHQYHHSHINDVIKLAERCQVKLTLINHVSNRYHQQDIQLLEARIRREAPDFNFRIARDFLSVSVNMV
ncbi:ribonuclease Z [Macrococcus carouselicus]|uniref:Ribonuclease Z n=1 Tax=Macrococcus carouselicus TaxID=69969 RepID=A0A9Q8CKC0_9STAP|nr:ribonuclease Z [Macrococcus carouselicus]TDM04308.1 ribonuclease Z [Macrococcus carouselicus]